MLGIRRMSLYSSYGGGFRTGCSKTGGKTYGETADGQKDEGKTA